MRKLDRSDALPVRDLLDRRVRARERVRPDREVCLLGPHLLAGRQVADVDRAIRRLGELVRVARPGPDPEDRVVDRGSERSDVVDGNGLGIGRRRRRAGASQRQPDDQPDDDRKRYHGSRPEARIPQLRTGVWFRDHLLAHALRAAEESSIGLTVEGIILRIGERVISSAESQAPMARSWATAEPGLRAPTIYVFRTIAMTNPTDAESRVLTATRPIRRSVAPSVDPGLKPIQPNTSTSVPITT